MSIEKACNKNVISLTEDSTVIEAAQAMKQHNVGDILIINQKDNKPVGIITDRDIVMAIASSNNGNIQSLRIADIASRELLTIAQDQDIEDAIDQMSSKGVRRAPIINASGQAVGIVSVDDLVPLLAKELQCLSNIIEKQAA